MKLSILLKDQGGLEPLGFSDVEITGISYDSRRVIPEHLFVAIPGFRVDGHDFIPDALARGAAALVIEKAWLERNPMPSTFSVPVVAVPRSRLALAWLAAAFYHHPARRLKVIGVTGTNGKTTTVHLISAILQKAGYSTGLISTVGFKVGERTWANDTHHTTPESLDIQRLLAEMVEAGLDYAIIETSSHALALDRVAGCEYDVAVFTNLTHDHLDFHQSIEQYFRDKSKLFLLLGDTFSKGIKKVGVINANDRYFEELKALCPVEVISFSLGGPATVMAKDIQRQGVETRFTIATAEEEITVCWKLAGDFNISNALAAAAVAYSQGVDLVAIKNALEAVSCIPGRMERVDVGQSFPVIVDFAHSPDALRQALVALRPQTQRRLMVVFGCAGERDRGRRWGMGQVAGELADYSVLTTDDPRSEDPADIITEIEAGLRAEGKVVGRDYEKIIDRRQAIAHALSLAGDGDVVLLAGMGHESSLLIGSEDIPWDEKEVAQKALEALWS
ncbi:MAG: UDP-N-acetylmuramoyl-L-alanyl-D-glutamate--2,6-diaminopimelate ligase [Chloroflexi bacterium]|nr:UDP-N-acetylmuramoyl-L-alanyl-D-glutamate--2,6-diaminopimelate ligase [Chloroflexota bacterium]